MEIKASVHSLPTCKTRHAGGDRGLADAKLVLSLDTEGVVVVWRQTGHIVAGASYASRKGAPVQVRQVLQHRKPSSLTFLTHQNICDKQVTTTETNTLSHSQSIIAFLLLFFSFFFSESPKSL